ncbi:hypothetical protein ACJIZ3_009904 [Penstemon smallii]|uniref:Uncharacterized protein n=1 Tax=Penstemon smallii TaxID=265156 RepID=A0ABD3TFM0_9LAMI
MGVQLESGMSKLPYANRKSLSNPFLIDLNIEEESNFILTVKSQSLRTDKTQKEHNQLPASEMLISDGCHALDLDAAEFTEQRESQQYFGNY